MFATILIALSYGINITMYVENGDNLSHLAFLLKYIQGNFGITVGTAEQPFCYDPKLNWQTAAILYSYMDGFITEQEFISKQDDINSLMALDNLHPFAKPVLKLVGKYNLQSLDPNGIATWLTNYRNMITSYGSIVPGSMVTMEKG
jgi:hypothetical protein